MIRIILSALIISLMLSTARHGLGDAPQSPDPQSEKIKRKLEKMKVSDTIILMMKDGRRFEAALVQTGATDFQVVTADSRQKVAIEYNQVKTIKKRLSPVATLAIASLVVVGTTLLLAVILVPRS